MMGNGLTGLLFGVGFAGWVYYATMHQTSNTKTSLIVAAGAGLVGFFVIYTLLASFFS